MWDASFSTSACKPAVCRERAAARVKKVTQHGVAGNQFLDERLQFGKASRYRKQFFLFSGKVEGDFLFEHLLNFGLPGFQIHIPGLECAVQAHT